MRFPGRIVLGAAVGSLATVCAAQPIAYPAMGQSARQQEQDTVQCQASARQAVGAGSAAAGASEPRSLPGEQLRDAIAGARVGSAAGGISDPAGEAAAAGAALGPMAAGERQRAGQARSPAGSLDGAFAACMSRRGYSIR
jgi:hypothetical protein